MEFLGLSCEEFDFFRKKDKMSKQEYEKSRNDVKHHFRSLCYELQKIYHKKTEGVLEINKDFPNFNKRSMNIAVEYGEKTSCLKKSIEMNTDNISVKLIFEANDLEASKLITSRLIDKKDIIWNYVIADKHNQINFSFKSKGNKAETIKYNSLDMNSKIYDAFTSSIENYINSGKYEFEIVVQHTCPKNEAVKQGKNLSNIIYEDMVKITDLYNKLS